MTYSVVVRDPNSWSASTGIHEELAHCGHKHKSFAAAQKCYDKLTEWRCLCGRTTKSYASCCGTPHNSTSATWYNAQIEEKRSDRGMSNLSKAAAVLGRKGGKIGGKSTSEAKAQAARANGKKGGRPKLCTFCKAAPATEHGREKVGEWTIEWHLCEGCFAKKIKENENGKVG